MKGQMEHLELQADRVEQVLGNFGIQAQVCSGQVLPQVISYQLRIAADCRLRKVQDLDEEIALALQVPGVLIRRVEGAITIEVPRLDGPDISVSAIMATLKRTPEAHTALLGLGNDGCPLLLYFPSPNVAHVLIAGMTGSGKTELLRTLLVSLVTWGAPRDMRFYLIDPKGRKLAELAGLQMVEACGGADDALPLLAQLIEVMENRDRVGYSSPRLYVVLDELADLVMVGGREVEAAITRLVQRGRESGIHVVATTQRASAAVVQGLMKANFPVRISGAVNSASEASIATGMPQSGAERLLGKGDMVIVYQGQVLRFKAAICDDEALEDLLLDDTADKSLDEVEDVRSLKERIRQRLKLVKPGRPAEPPTEAMIQFALERLLESGKCSQRELRRWHKKRFGHDINPPRASDAIEEAKRRLVGQSLNLSSKG